MDPQLAEMREQSDDVRGELPDARITDTCTAVHEDVTGLLVSHAVAQPQSNHQDEKGGLSDDPTFMGPPLSKRRLSVGFQRL